MDELIGLNEITGCIYTIRGVKVMLDRDLAAFYGVQTKRLKEQVRRNINRFPPDFMFELSKEEFTNWRSQFATSNGDKMGLRHAPMAFTEQGVAMLSGVLHSKQAIQINVQIMRAFVQLRHLVIDHAELKHEIDKLRDQTEEKFRIVFTVLDKLVSDDESVRAIGFVSKDL
jgi:hypothetical protein